MYHRRRANWHSNWTAFKGSEESHSTIKKSWRIVAKQQGIPCTRSDETRSHRESGSSRAKCASEQPSIPLFLSLKWLSAWKTDAHRNKRKASNETTKKKERERERERKGRPKKRRVEGGKEEKQKAKKEKDGAEKKKVKPRYGCTNRSLIKVSIVFRSRNAIISIQSSLVTLQWRRPDTCYTQTTIKRKKRKKGKKQATRRKKDKGGEKEETSIWTSLKALSQ